MAQGGGSNDAINIVDELVENSSFNRQHFIRQISKAMKVMTGNDSECSENLFVRRTSYSSVRFEHKLLRDTEDSKANGNRKPQPQSYQNHIHLLCRNLESKTCIRGNVIRGCLSLGHVGGGPLMPRCLRLFQRK